MLLGCVDLFLFNGFFWCRFWWLLLNFGFFNWIFWYPFTFSRDLCVKDLIFSLCDYFLILWVSVCAGGFWWCLKVYWWFTVFLFESGDTLLWFWRIFSCGFDDFERFIVDFSFFYLNLFIPIYVFEGFLCFKSCDFCGFWLVFRSEVQAIFCLRYYPIWIFGKSSPFCP